MVVKKKITRAGSSRRQTQVRNRLGEFLRDCRLKKNLSQTELAGRLGYTSPQFISDWERGVSTLPMMKLNEICRILGVRNQEMFDLLVDVSVEKLVHSMNEDYRQLRRKKMG